MFQQYHELKQGCPNAILFFRMGDFYEVFYEDAELCARELDIALTARNKHGDTPIPMAGVPHHAATGYITRLTDAGYRVAIAEQVEDPAKAKGLVKRAIVRVVTPGVVLDPTALAARESNHLAAVVQTADGVGVAFLDVSTGDLRCTTVDDVDAAVAELHRFEPKEALLSPELAESGPLLAALKRHSTLISEVEPEAWTAAEAGRELRTLLAVADLTGFGVRDGEPGVCAAGALVRYGRDLSGGALTNVHLLRSYRPQGFMVVDDTTHRNLEISRTLLGNRRHGTLLWLLDRTATSMGSRALKQWLAFPLLDVGAIEARQDAITALVDDVTAREDLRTALREVADIERIGARITTGNAHARDLAALRRSLEALPAALRAIGHLDALGAHLPTDTCADLAEELRAWLVDDPPIQLSEGGLINRGLHAELDEITSWALDGVGAISRLEERERAETGIATLKMRRNKMFGYYIEVTRAHVHKVPTDRYRRKQTLSNAERYITAELKELEEKVLGADERRKELEYTLFAALRGRVAAHSARLQTLARSLADLDVLAALADVAARQGWSRPEVDDSLDLALEQARHPVVEALLTEERFVPNDCVLDPTDRRLVVLTGPNMSGKSTTMRQVALAVLLAQIGSFVPAQRARIGLCDRIFTRVGASDDLSRGQSTFMVEMSETAAILHHATARSLVVLDEIGRGTSTYDGLSIAWAVAEDLASRVRCRALFATHYHELCDLAEALPGVVNQSVAVSEWGEQIIFLRTLKEGGASRSYGIQCARLAGLPDHVVGRARSLLSQFEKHAPRNDRQQLSLFGSLSNAAPDATPTAPPRSPALELLQTVDPDDLTPRAAHDLVYRLKDLSR